MTVYIYVIVLGWYDESSSHHGGEEIVTKLGNYSLNFSESWFRST